MFSIVGKTPRLSPIITAIILVIFVAVFVFYPPPPEALELTAPTGNQLILTGIVSIIGIIIGISPVVNSKEEQVDE